MANRHSRMGRPTVIVPSSVRKVVALMHGGMSVRQACAISGISHEAYYHHIRIGGQFSYILLASDEALLQKARFAVIEAINNGDAATSRWYLEHKDPEFQRVSKNGRGSDGH